VSLDKIKLVIESDFKQVHLIDKIIHLLCSSAELPDEKCYQTRICVVEAVNNAIQHAYSHEKNHFVEVNFSLEPEKMIISVSDRGQPMPARMLEKKAGFLKIIDESHQKDIPESGRGLALIQELMDCVDYSSREGKNTLTMVKVLKGGKKRKTGALKKRSSIAHLQTVAGLLGIHHSNIKKSSK
jgi:serine/threonine-protein kinase RsbW